MPFVPESAVWREKKKAGTLRRPRLRRAVLAASCASTTIVTTILSACGYAAAFGAIQLTPLQIIAGVPEVAPKVEEAKKALKAVEASAAALAKTEKGTPEFAAAKAHLDEAKHAKATADQPLKEVRGNIQRWQEIGGLLGRILLAVLLLFVPSRTLIRLFLIPGIILFPLTYFKLVHESFPVFAVAIFFCGLLTVAQFSFLSEFLPRVFPLHLRGTGGAFATNFGGRMIGTMAALLNTEILAPLFPGTSPPLQVASAAGVIGASVYFIALVATFLLPSPHHEVEKQAKAFGPGEAT